MTIMPTCVTEACPTQALFWKASKQPSWVEPHSLYNECNSFWSPLYQSIHNVVKQKVVYSWNVINVSVLVTKCVPTCQWCVAARRRSRREPEERGRCERRICQSLVCASTEHDQWWLAQTEPVALLGMAREPTDRHMHRYRQTDRYRQTQTEAQTQT